MPNKSPDILVTELANMLNRLDPETWNTLLPSVDQFVQDTRKALNEIGGEQRRGDERVPTRLRGTLTRLSDVRPGERKEFSVEITNLSQNGMGIQVEKQYIPSRLVRVTFVSPNGQVKDAVMQMKWMKKVLEDSGEFFEVGCRMATDDEVHRIQREDDKISQILHKVQRRKDVKIIVTGPETRTSRTLLTILTNLSFPVVYIKNIHVALTEMNTKECDVAIFTDWVDICQNAMILDQVNEKAAGLAKIAYMQKQNNMSTLLKTGIDECVSHGQDKSYILQAIERAMVAQVTHSNKKCQPLQRKALIVAPNSTITNLLSCYLDQYNFFVCQTTHLTPHNMSNYDMVFMDFHPDQEETFKLVRLKFANQPVIALCEHASFGHDALTCGANDILCLPPKANDVLQVIEKCADFQHQ
jgi:hypothetical protein